MESEIIDIKTIPEKISLLISNDYALLLKYDKNSVIYLFATSLIKKDGTPIIKVGFTKDIIKRYNDLKTEYGCEFYPISIINNLKLADEQLLHKFVRSQSNIVPYECIIDGVSKRELYYYTKNLYDIFISFPLIKDDISELINNGAYDGDINIFTTKQNKSKQSVTENEENITKKKKTIIIHKYVCEYCKTECSSVPSLNRHKKIFCVKNTIEKENAELKREIQQLKSDTKKMNVLEKDTNKTTNKTNNKNIQMTINNNNNITNTSLVCYNMFK